ncbi:hypothetical protein KY290_032917 [Solanum tuberosum]|uniref:Uncharacterized protein n=1 Tax=Solanum tuberosum TaxID=4113 RepID=A0ABQ7UDJ9_SOLTU|nr:hypothetical protein KY290_032917 [Solanum tuberosum]
MASTVGQPLDMDRATNDKTRPSTVRILVRLQTYGKKLGMIIYHIIVRDVNIRGIEKLIVELSLMVKLMSWSMKIILKEKNFKAIFVIISMLKKVDLNRLEVGEKDDEETVKDLEIGVEKSGVQDQNLVSQNSGQCVGKAVLDDYSFGNRMLSLIPKTDEFLRQENTSPNQQGFNSADRVGVEEQLVVDTNHH